MNSLTHGETLCVRVAVGLMAIGGSLGLVPCCGFRRARLMAARTEVQNGGGSSNGDGSCMASQNSAVLGSSPQRAASVSGACLNAILVLRRLKVRHSAVDPKTPLTPSRSCSI